MIPMIVPSILESMIELPFLVVQTLLTKAVCVSVYLILIYGLLYRIGFVNRLVQRWIEVELGRELNGAKVTLSSITLNLFQPQTIFTSSTITLHNLTIHTPHRSAWRWDAPIIAQVASIEASVHLLSLIKTPPFLLRKRRWWLPWGGNKDTPKGNTIRNRYRDPLQPVVRDVYGIVIKDVRVFVEKRRNVFNFHLLDKRLDIPDPIEVLASMERMGVGVGTSGTVVVPSSGVGNGESEGITGGGTATDGLTPLHTRVRLDSTAASSVSSTGNGNNGDNDDSGDGGVESKANEIVNHLLGAVSSLGRAVHDGGTQGATDVLMDQRDGMVSYLKRFRDVVGGGTGGVDGGSGSGSGGDGRDMEGNGSSGSSGLGGVRGGGDGIWSTERTPTTNETTSTKTTTNNITAGALGNIAREGNIIRSRTTRIAKEGIEVIKHVGKVVEKGVLDVKHQVDALSRPPPQKKDWKNPMNNEDVDLFRIGYIVARDLRVFSKGIVLVGSGGGGGGGGSGSVPMQSSVGGSDVEGSAEEGTNTDGNGNNNGGVWNRRRRRRTHNTTTSIGGSGIGSRIDSRGWSKPILVEEIVVHPTELCPSSPWWVRRRRRRLVVRDKHPYDDGDDEKNDCDNDHGDDDNEYGDDDDDDDLGMEIGQPIDHIMQVVLIKTLKEIAKCNTGQLLNNTFSDVFAWFKRT